MTIENGTRVGRRKTPGRMRARVDARWAPGGAPFSIALLLAGLTFTALLTNSASAEDLTPSTTAQDQDAPPPSQAPFDPEELDFQLSMPAGPFTVGQRVPIEITTRLPHGIQTESVELVGPGHLRVLNRDIEEVMLPGEGREVRAVLEVTVYRAGRHRARAVLLRVADLEGNLFERLSDPIEINVTSLLASENRPELRSEQTGLAVRYRDYKLAWVLGLGGFFSLLVLMVYLVARSRPRTVPPPPPVPTRPAHEVALEKLDAIRSAHLIESGLQMEFHMRLSEVVREYFGGRYGWHALEATTTEIVEWLSQMRLPPTVTSETISHLLHECDLVKFAKQVHSEEEQQDYLSDAYRVVRETMLQTTTEERDIEASAKQLLVQAEGDLSSDRENPIFLIPESSKTDSGAGAESTNLDDEAGQQDQSQLADGDDSGRDPKEEEGREESH